MEHHELKSPPPRRGGDSRDLRDRIMAAELKLMTGEPLGPQDERLLAYTVFAAGCSSCGQ